MAHLQGCAEALGQLQTALVLPALFCHPALLLVLQPHSRGFLSGKPRSRRWAHVTLPCLLLRCCQLCVATTSHTGFYHHCGKDVCLHALHGTWLHVFYTRIYVHILCINPHSNPKQQKLYVFLPVVLSCSNVNAGYDGLRGQEALHSHAWHFRFCVTKHCSSAQS